MLTPQQIAEAQRRTAALLDEAGIVLTPSEQARIEVADFGLNRLGSEGLELYTYVNTDRYCAKELVMFPGQTCPEHRHPAVRADSGKVIDPGKMETFRVRRGTVYLFVENGPNTFPDVHAPRDSAAHYRLTRGVRLDAGEQYTIPPNTWHWFQAGAEGAIVSEFSSTSRDELDEFTDPRILRETVVGQSKG